MITPLQVTVIAFGEREWRAAMAAFLRFGRIVNAAAYTADDSLLFVGDDFARTDISPA